MIIRDLEVLHAPVGDCQSPFPNEKIFMIISFQSCTVTRYQKLKSLAISQLNLPRKLLEKKIYI